MEKGDSPSFEMNMRFDLSYEEWAALEPWIPETRKPPRVDYSRIVGAILYAFRSGAHRHQIR